MILRPAKAEDLAHLDGVLERVLEQMKAQGLNQWDQHYPTEALFRSDLEKGWLLVAAEKEGALPSASLCLNRDQEPEYAGVDWQLQSESVHVVHRLMVDPAAEGHGFGQALMGFAEQTALAAGSTAMRLDTYSENQRAIRFYKSLKYSHCGQVFFAHRQKPFLCFEKALF